MTRKFETWSPQHRAQHEAKKEIVEAADGLLGQYLVGEWSEQVIEGRNFKRLMRAAKRLRLARVKKENQK